MREQERVHIAQNYIEISSDFSSSSSLYDSLETFSDDSSDLGKRKKIVTSSNKSSIFPDKHRSNNEETPLKQPHQDAFMSKQETLEIIKGLHIKCGLLDAEHLFMIPINWLNYHKFPGVHVEIAQNLYNTYFTPKLFLLRKISMVGIPKSTDLVIIFRVFMWPLSLKNALPISIIQLQCFVMVSQVE